MSAHYIHQAKDWPELYWEYEPIVNSLARVRNQQGRLLGKMESLGFKLREEAYLQTLTIDAIKTSEIEGEKLNRADVRSSVARRLGINIPDLSITNRDVEGIVDILIDATQNCQHELTAERLFDWHAALFPTGRSGMYRITVGDWRQEGNGPMQVVSGAMGFERVHFEAPAATKVPGEMQKFLDWFNADLLIDPIIKAAVAHFWFLTIHPFDDGNGRLARALCDMLLARADGVNQRFYSMSSQIRKERKKYYLMLESCQKSSLDITTWLVWFLECLENTLNETEHELAGVMFKARFWQLHTNSSLNERQKKIVNQLLDGFKGKLNTSKYAKITKCSQDTALRDIQSLISKGMLLKEESGGRSTSYTLQKDLNEQKF